MPTGPHLIWNLTTPTSDNSLATDQSIIWHGFAFFLWAGLAIIAWSKQRRLPSSNEQFLCWAFLVAFTCQGLALVLDLLMAADFITGAFASTFVVLLNQGLQQSAVTTVAAGFIWFLTAGKTTAKRFALLSLGLIAISFLGAISAISAMGIAQDTPTNFRQHPFSILIPSVAVVLLVFPLYYLLVYRSRWLRGWTATAIFCFLLFDVLAILQFAMPEKSPGIVVHVGRVIYLLGIGLIAFVYVRELVDKLASETIQQRIWKERFEAFMDNSPFVAWVKNSAGEHQYLSQPYTKQIGTPTRKWEGKTDYDLWSEEVAKSHLEMDKLAMEAGKPIVFESNHPLPNGEIKNWFVVKFPFRVGDENELYIGGIGLDVTEKKQAEIDRDRFFENSSELMCIADEQMRFRRVNRAFEEILGFSREELMSRPFREFVHPSDLVKMDNAFKRTPESNVIGFETRFRCKDDSHRLISWTSPAPEAGSVVDSNTVFAVGRDVTEQRALEERLLKIADDEKQRIADDLHDGLGQELTGLAMMAESLALNLKDLKLPESELANKIAVQLEASQELTRSLARGLRPIEIDAYGLKSALSQLADQTSESYGIGCSFDSEGAVGKVDAESATQLYRIAQEAVTNAARHANPQSVQIHLVESNGTLSLKIVDDGCGILNIDASRAGIGMKSMQYRSDVIGGKLTVGSNGRQGTMVACSLIVS